VTATLCTAFSSTATLIGTVTIEDAMTAAPATGSTSIAGTLESLFAGTDLRSGTDLVIDELDQWRIAGEAIAGFSTQTFNLVVVPGK
jgi:hypothetical protein